MVLIGTDNWLPHPGCQDVNDLLVGEWLAGCAFYSLQAVDIDGVGVVAKVVFNVSQLLDVLYEMERIPKDQRKTDKFVEEVFCS